MAWALQVIAGVPRAVGGLLSAVVLLAYFSGGGLLASAAVNLVQLVTLLFGFLLALPVAWAAAGGWAGLAAAAGPHDAGYGSFGGMGVPAILGLAVVFVPSFIVSPGLIQKTFGARSARQARRAVLANAVALAAFAFVPALLGMSMRALEPGLANPELALPRLTTDVLQPWLGALALAALFAAEISTADAVLFMLSTSLSRDLYQSLIQPNADERALLRVGRAAALVGGALGVALALLLPSVASALVLFYTVMTASLFVPLLAGLFSARPRAAQARLAIGASVVVTAGLRLALGGGGTGGWLPSVAGIAAAALVFASAWLPVRPAREAAGRATGCYDPPKS
jgi:SSS family solute:Na+ symporter